ncbi:uncharacterized protein LOC143585500 [Bidens hawaiensis]|uniref:uncharacterized protein LOC143585500 n=1 Tax=Bidens hawaiensis TaxID=980011 RepID=UPI004049873C
MGIGGVGGLRLLPIERLLIFVGSGEMGCKFCCRFRFCLAKRSISGSNAKGEFLVVNRYLVVAYAKIVGTHLKKLNDRVRSLVHIGVETGSKAYRLFDPNTQKVVIACDVVFHEKKTWVWSNSGQNNEETELALGLFWVDWNGVVDTGVGQVVTELMGSDSISDENSALSPNSATESATAFVANLDSPSIPLATDSDALVANSSNSATSSAAPAAIGLEVEEDIELLLLEKGEPRNFGEAKSKPESIKAMQMELESIKRNDTWKLTELLRGAKAIVLKRVFKGYVQQPGVDFDEVFAPVARLETIRMLIAIAVTEGWQLHHLDVNSAFLHGELQEEVFVSQPDGFVKAGEENKVYKLTKA